MVKKPKEVTSIRIDPDLNEICNKLKLNKGPIVERALKLEVMRRLNIMKFDKMAIQQGLIGYLQEEKRIDDANDLVRQRLEQEEYVQTQEKELQETQNRKILLEFEDFCSGLNAFRPRSEHARIRESFISYILGDVSGWQDHSNEEARLIQHFARKGLPTDLNLLRPLLKKGQPIIRGIKTQ